MGFFEAIIRALIYCAASRWLCFSASGYSVNSESCFDRWVLGNGDQVATLNPGRK